MLLFLHKQYEPHKSEIHHLSKNQIKTLNYSAFNGLFYFGATNAKFR